MGKCVRIEIFYFYLRMEMFYFHLFTYLFILRFDPAFFLFYFFTFFFFCLFLRISYAGTFEPRLIGVDGAALRRYMYNGKPNTFGPII